VDSVTKNTKRRAPQQDTTEHSRYRVRMPGFLVDDAVGLGDVIKHTASYIGIKPCGGCQRRARTLNRWVAFTRRPPR
jgi:hypothetical protein